MTVIKNKIRTLSGVTPVALLTKPYPCPGKCIYCPTQKGIPKSYLKNEPAVMRAIANQFDPVKQVHQRLKMYETSGHSIDKIEIIIIGGTWSYYPMDYQRKFIASIYWALNNYKSKLLTVISSEVEKSRLPKATANYASLDSSPVKDGFGMTTEQVNFSNLNEEKRKNEKAKCRCVGMSVETRPDYIRDIKDIKILRYYGVTRVELGVQTVNEKLLKLIKRGHRRKEIIRATRLLKDAGFKVCYHLMPNLPGSTPEKDYQVFKEVFENPDFRPDQLKIYPCILAGESELREWYKDGRWKPYSDKTLVELLVKIKSEIIPRYIRIMRLWRDIPATEVEAGSEMSHMRQVISKQLTVNSLQCKCVRCREIMDNPQEKKLILKRTDYQTSGGQEVFLEFVDKFDRIYGLLRLRIPNFSFTPGRCSLKHYFDSPTLPILKNGGIVRELHVFGQSLNFSFTPGRCSLKHGEVQHRGLGRKLLIAAEKIVKNEFKLPKISVISGVGVRQYYRGLGYQLKDEYMVKNL